MCLLLHVSPAARFSRRLLEPLRQSWHNSPTRKLASAIRWSVVGLRALVATSTATNQVDEVSKRKLVYTSSDPIVVSFFLCFFLFLGCFGIFSMYSCAPPIFPPYDWHSVTSKVCSSKSHEPKSQAQWQNCITKCVITILKGRTIPNKIQTCSPKGNANWGDCLKTGTAR